MRPDGPVGQACSPPASWPSSGSWHAGALSEAPLAFARTVNPNTKAIPHWPSFSLAGRPTMVFDAAAKPVNDPRGDERRMFEKVPYVQPGT